MPRADQDPKLKSRSRKSARTADRRSAAALAALPDEELLERVNLANA